MQVGTKMVRKPANQIPVAPKRVTPEIRHFSREVAGADPFWVPVTPMGKPANCFLNCRGFAEQHGGEAVSGWSIWELPGLYLHGETHAVWRRGEDYLDITPLQVGRETSVLFVPDPRVFENLDSGGHQEARFFPLSRKSMIRRACEKLNEAGGLDRLNPRHWDAWSEGDDLIEVYFLYQAKSRRKRR